MNTILLTYVESTKETADKVSELIESTKETADKVSELNGWSSELGEKYQILSERMTKVQHIS